MSAAASGRSPPPAPCEGGSVGRWLAALTAALVLAAPAAAAPDPRASTAGLTTGAAGAVPGDTLLVKGAWSSASGAPLPLPEEGRLGRHAYRNAYLGLRLPLPRGWRQAYKGPPPSDTGYYVLLQLAPPAGTGKSVTALLTAQDMFFAATPAESAAELLRHLQGQLPAGYTVEQSPQEVRIGARTYTRLAYSAPDIGLHWVVLATQIRCHLVQLVLTGRDRGELERLARRMGQMPQLPGAAAAPVCIEGYATPGHLLTRVEPVFSGHRFNHIPVRIVIDRAGRVTHIHFISAFPEQAKAVTDALTRWRFKPARVNGKPVAVETGVLFGYTAHPDSPASQ